MDLTYAIQYCATGRKKFILAGAAIACEAIAIFLALYIWPTDVLAPAPPASAGVFAAYLAYESHRAQMSLGGTLEKRVGQG